MFERRKFLFYALNVFEHKIKLIMPWQIDRKVLVPVYIKLHQISTAFLRKSMVKVGLEIFGKKRSVQVGISNARL